MARTYCFCALLAMGAGGCSGAANGVDFTPADGGPGDGESSGSSWAEADADDGADTMPPGPDSDDGGGPPDSDDGSDSGGDPIDPGNQGGFGTDTRGGLDGEILVVDTLAESGPGSLRWAVGQSGPRLVVFEVGGVIALEDDLGISNPDLTVAGQTAPSPGISLHHARVSIKTHDVVLQHLRVRPGDRHANGQLVSNEIADNRDAILIGTSSKDTHHIVLDNLSLTWSLDETVSVWYGRTYDITIRDSIIAEPLSVSLHPESSDGTSHGYCLLFGDDIVRASVIGNIFGHCTRRTPRAGPGNEVVVLDNVIYNAIETAINTQGPYATDTTLTVIGNVFKPGANTKDSTALLLNKTTGSGGVRAFLEDNTLMGHALLSGATATEQLSEVEVWDDSHEARDPAAVFDIAIAKAGARPTDRDPVDERIIEDVVNATGVRIDYTDDVGGYPELMSTTRALELPADPHGDPDGDGVTVVEAWLSTFTAEVE